MRVNVVPPGTVMPLPIVAPSWARGPELGGTAMSMPTAKTSSPTSTACKASSLAPPPPPPAPKNRPVAMDPSAGPLDSPPLPVAPDDPFARLTLENMCLEYLYGIGTLSPPAGHIPLMAPGPAKRQRLNVKQPGCSGLSHDFKCVP